MSKHLLCVYFFIIQQDIYRAMAKRLSSDLTPSAKSPQIKRPDVRETPRIKPLKASGSQSRLYQNILQRILKENFTYLEGMCLYIYIHSWNWCNHWHVCIDFVFMQKYTISSTWLNIKSSKNRSIIPIRYLNQFDG